jgi:glyoxylase I family protein
MPVTGIGGIFFRAHDPAGLSSWYRTHLGIETGDTPWQQAAGPTVFAPFAETTTYFPAEKQWMLNLRVADLDGLSGAGIEVITKPEWDMPGIGRFARLHDPEGNPIELWEPSGD